MPEDDCPHDFAYIGGVNVAVDGIIDGTVDVWTCGRCGARDFLGRGPGVTEPPSHIGFQPLRPDEKCLVLVCRQSGKPAWRAIRARSGDSVTCSCGELVELSSYQLPKDFKPETGRALVRTGFHELFLVDDWMNETIDLTLLIANV